MEGERVMFLKGETVYLRPPELSDVPHMTRWINDLEVSKYLIVRTPMSTLSEEEWVKKQGKEDNSIYLEIVLKDGDKPIGNLSLHGIRSFDHNASLGIMIGEKAYWSNGYGSEAIKLLLSHAFNYLNLHKVSLCVLASNERAQKAYKKCGFVATGREPEEVFVDGRYEDMIFMSILRRDFLNP